MATLNMRLDGALDRRLQREAELQDRTRSDVARQAIASFLAQRERQRFLDEIARAARRGSEREAVALAEEALETDNEALAIAEHRVSEPKTRYRVTRKKR
jgi:predicted transcriptional regulator